MTVQYGSIIPANIDLNDIDLWFAKESNNGNVSNLIKLDTLTYVKKVSNPINLGETVSGLYNLYIPPSFYITNGIGIYNFYLTPRTFRAKITDVSFLEGTDIRGVVVNLDNIEEYGRNKLFRNNSISGYLVKYVDNSLSSDNIINNLERIVTANYRVEPVNSSLNTNNNSFGVKYRFNNTSNSVFMVLNPTLEGVSGLENDSFIGQVNQDILISNTYFEPQLVKVELTKYDNETLYNGIFGNQTFNFAKGIRTFYDQDGNIIDQRTETTIKDSLNNDLKKTAKLNDVIDNSETL